MPLKFTMFETEMGWMGIAGTKKGICRAILPMPDEASAFSAITEQKESNFESLKSEQNGWFSDVKDMLIGYFKGQNVDFSFPLDLDDYTKFQKDVWEATESIPYGELRTYGWVASQIGKPKSARAVGNALGANPIPIIIPCHRVVGSDGSLHGFSGGLHWKQRLIDLEKK
ncbi:MAG: methylated-DNA-[protein]-cysteine S-methyltransferase [Candidatus Poribacteria bacterium]|nr:methylated-DNA-[protein]-cysteine S-methyltransferase [Candidatus Poribacteria bacterium]